MSTFILASDDPRALQAFGREVAPRLRELAERERSSGDPLGAAQSK